MSAVLHLTLGDSAAGCLRAACESHGMPGEVVGIAEDLSHGPLDDGKARMQYMRDCFVGYGDFWLESRDAFEAWPALLDRIDAGKTTTVVVWAGNNVSETLFLHMACWWLRDRPLRLLHVNVSAHFDDHYVAIFPPGELAGIFTHARELDQTERASHVSEFQRLRDEGGGLRRWSAGRVVAVPADYY